MRSPSRSASPRRFSASIPHPSPRTNPSARASNVLQRPSRVIIPASWNASIPLLRRITLTPPASARSASPR